jgi:hypothetical protein
MLMTLPRMLTGNEAAKTATVFMLMRLYCNIPSISADSETGTKKAYGVEEKSINVRLEYREDAIIQTENDPSHQL